MKILNKAKIGTMLDTYVKNSVYYVGTMEDFQKFIENLKLDLVEKGSDEVYQTKEKTIPFDDAKVFKLIGNKEEKSIYYKKHIDDNFEVYEFCEII